METLKLLVCVVYGVCFIHFGKKLFNCLLFSCINLINGVLINGFFKCKLHLHSSGEWFPVFKQRKKQPITSSRVIRCMVHSSDWSDVVGMSAANIMWEEKTFQNSDWKQKTCWIYYESIQLQRQYFIENVSSHSDQIILPPNMVSDKHWNKISTDVTVVINDTTGAVRMRNFGFKEKCCWCINDERCLYGLMFMSAGDVYFNKLQKTKQRVKKVTELLVIQWSPRRSFFWWMTSLHVLWDLPEEVVFSSSNSGIWATKQVQHVKFILWLSGLTNPKALTHWTEVKDQRWWHLMDLLKSLGSEQTKLFSTWADGDVINCPLQAHCV